MSWTDERVELLNKLVAGRLSASQIAAELGQGITRNAVIGKVARLGLQLKGLAPRGRAPSKAPARPPALPPKPNADRPGIMAVASGVAAYAQGAGMKPLSSAMRFAAPAAPLDEAGKAAALALPPLVPSLLELREGQCKFPSGESGFQFCGREQTPGSPYCAAHHAMSATPARTPPRDREPRSARKGERRERVVDCVEAFGGGR
jgi:GcrA cell cycle regulator